MGSIKSQIGHLKAVAGCAGMIKVVLALKHKTIPRSINVKEPPKMKDGATIQETAIFINTKMRPWFTPPGMPRRAGVSSNAAGVVSAGSPFARAAAPGPPSSRLAI